MQLNSLRLKLIAAFLLLALIPLTATGIYGHFFTSNALSGQALERSINQVRLQAESIDSALSQVKGDALYLSALRSLNMLRQQNRPEAIELWTHEVGQDLLVLASVRSMYYAVRLIGTDGSERIGVRADDDRWIQTPHKTLSECKIGIFGLGAIGSKIETKLNAISSCEISYFSRSRKNSLEQSQGLNFSNLKSIFEDCDLVVSSVNYNDSSHHKINSSIFQGANNKLVFLNFSNPKIVNPQDLKQGLVNNQIKMAYFDGYYDEWIENRGEKYDRYGLLKLGPEKFIATSHIAAQSNSAIQSILAMALEHIQTRLESPDTPNLRPS